MGRPSRAQGPVFGDRAHPGMTPKHGGGQQEVAPGRPVLPEGVGVAGSVPMSPTTSFGAS